MHMKYLLCNYPSNQLSEIKPQVTLKTVPFEFFMKRCFIFEIRIIMMALFTVLTLLRSVIGPLMNFISFLV